MDDRDIGSFARDTQGPPVEPNRLWPATLMASSRGGDDLVGEWRFRGIDYLTEGEGALAPSGGLGRWSASARGCDVTVREAQRAGRDQYDLHVLDDLDEAVGELCRDAAELARYVRVVRRRGRPGGRGRRHQIRP
jgi:hypothetical protein